MTEPLGFLSYTRRDDQFFGGYITKFREALEAGVQVVTGDRGFKLFQDIEGIVIGEQWEKKLALVIGRASFFLPMLSPLFLSSPNCREEVELFVGRERASGRDDMILPVYLVDSPKLEKAEERDRDPIAAEIAKRQRYDWRENAWLPLDQPAARRAVLTLAQAIATAMERIATPAPGSRGGPAGAAGLEFGARRRPGRHGADRGRRRAGAPGAAHRARGPLGRRQPREQCLGARRARILRRALHAGAQHQRGAGPDRPPGGSRRSSPTWGGRASPRRASTCCSGCVTGAARSPTSSTPAHGPRRR